MTRSVMGIDAAPRPALSVAVVLYVPGRVFAGTQMSIQKACAV